MKKTKQTPKPRHYLTQQQAHEEFVNSFSKPDDGSNCHAKDFSLVMQQLANSVRSFTFEDVLRETRNFQISFDEAKKLFKVWVIMMRQLCKVSSIEGAYDSETYIFN